METDTKSHYGSEKTDRSTTNRLTDATLPLLVFDKTKGPFESQKIEDMDTAQVHYYETREITIFDPQQKKDYATMYQLFYPEKPVEPAVKPPAEAPPECPFEGISTYTAHYPPKEAPPGPVMGNPNTRLAPPTIDDVTINQEKYEDPKQVLPVNPPKTRPAAPPAHALYDIPTYLDHFPPKKVPYHKGPPADRTKSPPKSRITTTTYQDHYIPKDLPDKLLPAVAEPGKVPFIGSTTYLDEYPPKRRPNQPTVISCPEGIKVPRPRKDLGVEKVIVDGVNVIEENVFHVLIRALDGTPARGRQVFTTVHDGQTQTTILVLHGFSRTASENDLLGQFDIINIPPMPKYYPKIEVTFHLDKNDILTAEARDLDGPRHKAWRAAGGAIVLRKP